MEKKQKRTLIIIAVVALAVVAAVVVIIFATQPKTNENAKNITIIVVDNEKNEKNYNLSTEAEYLSEAMDELAEAGNFSYEGADEAYGLTIYVINGVEANYNKDSAYWTIYVNGEYGMYGADAQPVADGDVYTFKYETY